MTAAGLLLIQNGALVPSLDVLPIPGSDWAKRVPLLLLFLITYAITVSRYFATTTATVERLTSGEPRTVRGANRRAGGGRS